MITSQAKMGSRGEGQRDGKKTTRGDAKMKERELLQTVYFTENTKCINVHCSNLITLKICVYIPHANRQVSAASDFYFESL